MLTVTADVTATVDVDIEVFCGRCGAGLCRQSTAGKTSGRGQPYITVNPCKACLAEAETDAHNEGYDEGYKEGSKEA